MSHALTSLFESVDSIMVNAPRHIEDSYFKKITDLTQWLTLAIVH